MPNGFTNLKNDHQYLAGGVLLLIGLFGLYGSFTGTLAPMLAALFDPPALRNVKGSATILKLPPAAPALQDFTPGEPPATATPPDATVAPTDVTPPPIDAVP